ncbi:hypothetical protein [Paludisphaera rhizosphaerae]|uniref:hypothetical protein n=1 Tax=Paludisphaera rhizosphaerae TaxID=2711216 RepID=UPI0013EA3C60|nr:hypothetical protein [Paludisphaera rhizosphaerae]
MAFRFHNLDGTTRAFMVSEVDRDASQGVLYLSPRLTERGRIDWPNLLRAAVQRGDEARLAESLRGTGRLRELEPRRNPRGRGRPLMVRVPVTAPTTLADGEFNRFYIRGLCLRALDEGVAELEVYRAKEVGMPRPESIDLVGRRVPVGRLLDDLRFHSGEEEPEMRVPGGPNSGLSVRLA